MRTWASSDSYDVDGTHHFGGGRSAVHDQAHCLFLQGLHSLGDRELPHLLMRDPIDDELAHLVGHHEQLVDADPLEVAGVGAEVASDAVLEAADRLLSAEGPDEVDLVRGRLVSLQAGSATPTHKALSHHCRDGGGDKE